VQRVPLNPTFSDGQAEGRRASTSWRVRRIADAAKGEKKSSAGLPRSLRKTCSFFFVRPKGRRSPPKPGVALRYVRCLISRAPLQITATPVERSSVPTGICALQVSSPLRADLGLPFLLARAAGTVLIWPSTVLSHTTFCYP
jgi:hypothetical protein